MNLAPELQDILNIGVVQASQKTNEHSHDIRLVIDDIAKPHETKERRQNVLHLPCQACWELGINFFVLEHPTCDTCGETRVEGSTEEDGKVEKERLRGGKGKKCLQSTVSEKGNPYGRTALEPGTSDSTRIHTPAHEAIPRWQET
eukprot:TRINITY_DN450_c0_g2_i3.p1 TRINITY_DN450_c0_g2~~TRINITY_DN450_c0_g2_i3.p1  ORF type:complete len:145 (+),score=16.47 TRINITY_DN450_c0_g2_i3:463-897(+)